MGTCKSVCVKKLRKSPFSYENMTTTPINVWTVVIFISLLCLPCTVSRSLPSPTNVSFTSVNLRNVLHWFPGNGTPDGTHFTVEFAIYGDSIPDTKGKRVHWRRVRQCTEIVRTWCDLSTETWDEEQGYHARVRAMVRRASSKWALTQRRFDPKSETTFGPPLVSVEIEDNSAIISLMGPMRYQPNNHTPAISMKAIYAHMTYNLSIHNTHRNQMHHFPVVNNSNKYRLLEYSTEYCFSAQSRFLSMPVHCQSSAWYCITTPQDPVIEQLRRAVVGIVVPSLFICIIVVVGYLVYFYVTGKGQKSPYMLNPHSFHRSPLAFPPDNHNFIIISVIEGEPPSSDPPCPELMLRIPDPPPRYSPQSPEAPIEPEEPLDDLSIDYGAVCTAPKVDVEGQKDTREGKHDGGDAGNNLTDEQQISPQNENKNDGSVQDAHSGGVYLSQGKSYLSQRSAQTCRPTHMQIHANRAVSTLVQARPWSQEVTALPTLTQAQLQSAQGSVTGELNVEMKNREASGLLISRHPHTGLFNIPANLQTQTGVEERGQDMDAKMGEEEGNDCENVPLLSSYVSQSIRNMPTSDQSDCLATDYGVLIPATTQNTERDDFHEMEEGAICINWDPETGKLELPEMEMDFNEEEELDGLLSSNRAEDSGAAENDKMYIIRGELKLESVFVRQTSEEEAEAQEELERSEETRWEADDVLTKWDLVISMEQ